MNITKELKKAFTGLFIVSFVLFGLGIFLHYKELLYSVSGENSLLRLIVDHVYNLAGSIAFWFAVGYISKDMISALIALGFKIISSICSIYILNTTHGDVTHLDFWFVPVTTILSFLAFGLLHFKHIKGLWMLVVYVLLNGLRFSSGAFDYFEMFNSLLRFVDIYDPLTIRFETENSTYRMINILQYLTTQFYLPLSFLVFYFIFNKIKTAGKFDFSLRTVEISKKFDWVSFSMIYWVFRLVLIASVFGILHYMNFFLRESGLSVLMVLNLLSFFATVYVVGSLYRNYITAYVVSKKRYPSWLYICLNIPVINFIAWIIVISISQGNLVISEDETAENIDEEINIVQTLQKRFVEFSRNQSLKVVIIIFLIISFILKITNSIRGLGLTDGMGQIEYIIFAVISFLLTVWYLSERKAMYILFGIQSLSILATLLLEKFDLTVAVSTTGLINLFFYYSLFHFDALKFVKAEQKIE